MLMFVGANTLSISSGTTSVVIRKILKYKLGRTRTRWLATTAEIHDLHERGPTAENLQLCFDRRVDELPFLYPGSTGFVLAVRAGFADTILLCKIQLIVSVDVVGEPVG